MLGVRSAGMQAAPVSVGEGIADKVPGDQKCDESQGQVPVLAGEGWSR